MQAEMATMTTEVRCTISPELATIVASRDIFHVMVEKGREQAQTS